MLLSHPDLVPPQEARAAESRGGRGARVAGGGGSGPRVTVAPIEEQHGAEGEHEAIAARHRVPSRGRGGRRWYYVARDRRVSFLELPEDHATLLEEGQGAIVEAPAGEVWLIDRAGAAELHRLRSGWLRCWRHEEGR